MGPLRGHRLLLAISPALLTACHSSPQKEQEKLRRELKSWEATAQLTDELSRRGALPSVYVRQVREAVEQGRQEVQQKAAKLGQFRLIDTGSA